MYYLLRDIKERLFPPRPFIKIMTAQKSQEDIEHKQIEKSIEEQIKVLDNILEELAPEDGENKDEIKEPRERESPEAISEE